MDQNTREMLGLYNSNDAPKPIRWFFGTLFYAACIMLGLKFLGVL